MDGSRPTGSADALRTVKSVSCSETIWEKEGYVLLQLDFERKCVEEQAAAVLPILFWLKWFRSPSGPVPHILSAQEFPGGECGGSAAALAAPSTQPQALRARRRDALPAIFTIEPKGLSSGSCRL